MSTTTGVKPPRVWVLPLPWTKAPLSLNQRLNHYARYRLEQNVKHTAKALAQSKRIPRLDRCRVELVYVPRDRRRRDEDNLVASLKPLCDGLVLAGVVPDDTPWFMEKPSPRIAAADAAERVRWRLVVTELDGLPGAPVVPEVVEEVDELWR